ncbi:MAG: MBL fold metallo-hydrolase [Alphaproteobacteria bacterium]|nr:MBL fold metallo-hydrolase [Alphaproteobacteria bacterium]
MTTASAKGLKAARGGSLLCAALAAAVVALAAPVEARPLPGLSQFAQGAQPKAEGCPHLLSQAPVRRIPASVGKDKMRLTFVGHATFLLETPAGVKAVTDYNDYVRPADPPTVITMNRAHSTHYTDNPPLGIPHVLRGWDPAGGPAAHDITVQDMRVRNVVTNLRGWSGGTDYHGNSMFVFEASLLCVAHLGHLHHELTQEHLNSSAGLMWRLCRLMVR